MSAARRWPALLLTVLPLAVALVGPWIAPHDPLRPLGQPLAPAGTLGLFGTDHLGRDVLSRVLAGGQGVVLISVAALLATEAVGVGVGIAAGYARRFGRAALLGAAELLLAVPPLLVLAAAVAGFGRSPVLLLVATALVLLPSLVPVVATATSSIVGQPWVEAAVLAGESRRAVLYRELLPNLVPVLAADAGIRLVSAVYLISTAGFLGFGPTPPAPDWGLMITEARTTMALQPWPVILPATLVVLFALGANLLTRHAVERIPVAHRLPVRPAAKHEVTEVVTVEALSIAGADGRTILDAVSLRVPAGGAVALVGPSGSGKTTLALALLGRVRPGLRVSGGHVDVAGLDPLTAEPAALVRLRRHTVGYVPQDPASALTPTMRVGTLLRESLRGRTGVGADELLGLVRLPLDREFRRRRPHQLSGGQRQRLALAMALAGQPSVLVLDEPTAALDTATAREVTTELAGICAAAGCALVVVTHDVAVARRLATEAVVLDGGRVVAAGPTTDVLGDRPPGPSPAAATAGSASGLQVRDLRAGHARFALDGITVDVRPGECLVVLGGSGSGKTTLARCIAGLHPLTGGQLLLDGRALGTVHEREPALRRRIAMVFQDPTTSLNPSRTVAQLIGRPARLRGADPAAVTEQLLAEVRLPQHYATRRPRELSGGERQRVAIARALAGNPELLICDEITSALDHASATAVCDLIDGLRARHGLAMLVITHDLAVARRLAHRVLVLDAGRVRAHGAAPDVLDPLDTPSPVLGPAPVT